MTDIHPREWQASEWHPDFSDPIQELEMLRAFCIESVRVYPKLNVKLVHLEEGYMFVGISSDGKTLAELWVADHKQGQRYGLFVLDSDDAMEEYYFTNIDDGIRRIAEML